MTAPEPPKPDDDALPEASGKLAPERAIKIAVADLYAWPQPRCPHKIAFRKGIVLHECNRFGKKLDAVCRITEDDGLVDLKFREEGIEAVDFIFLVNKSVILRDTP